jgi:hypothetical protein
VASVTAQVVLRERSRFIAAVAAAPAVLLLAHLLPASGPGLALRLAGAAACVFLLPGALVLRALAWPSSPAVAVAASLALSLAVFAFGLALVFVVGTSILLAGGFLLVVSACAAVLALLKGESRARPHADHRPLGAVLGAGILLGGLVWWGAGPIYGDTYFHLARLRKLAEFDSLTTLTTVDEFKDGGLHPGYAFPLLHGVEALIGHLAGVDVVDVLLYVPAVLVPLAFVLAYAAGSAVFRSPAGGLALVAAQAAQVGLSRRDTFFEGTGLYETLSQPQAASRLLLAPAIIALAFTFMREGGWILLASLGAGAFALSAIHPTYAPYVALVFAGFLLARVVLVRGWEPLLTRAALALGTIVVPFGLFLILLFPVVRGTRAVTPSAADRAAELERNLNNFTTVGDWFGYSPSAIAREGPVVVAGLLAVPLAAFAARRLWAAFVLGGSLVVLTVLLTPPLFTALSDAFSVSQSRRLAGFIPIAFAVAGGCIVASRLRAFGMALAAGAGGALTVLYPGEFMRRVEEGGPEWAVAVAVAGGLVALLAGALRRSQGPNPGMWAAGAAVAFVAPVLIAGVFALERVRPLTELTPGIVAAVRAQTAPGDVLFSDRMTAYEIAAFAPVYINAGPPGNVADTSRNRPRIRAVDTRRFFRARQLTNAERRGILGRYGADWVVVDKEKQRPQEFLRTLAHVFEDDRYVLYRVSR